MRKGWEYKKLGDCTQILDSQRKPVTKRDRKSGIYPYYGATGIQDYVDKYIFDGRYVLVGEDGAKWSSFTQSAFIIEGKTWVNNHAHVLRTNDFLVDSFLVYFLNYSDLDSYISGAIIRKLTQASLRNIDIPLPPKSTQLAIVSELDKINELIRLKKEQLKDFDNLAQSLFYEMFGDPVENEKGWEVKKLGEIAKSAIGLTYKPENVTEELSGTVVLRSSNIQNSILDFNDIVRVNVLVKEDKMVNDGDILMCSRNGSFRLVGKVALIKGLKERMSYGAFMTIIKSPYNPYLFEYFKTPAFRQYLITGKTTTVNQITVKMLNNLTLPLPPLSLQRLFAQRIEQIEREKSEVQKSIQDLETLLASRMQYWFE